MGDLHDVGSMGSIRHARLALLAVCSTFLLACQKPAEQTTGNPPATPVPVSKSGQLRAVVIGTELPMVRKADQGFDGLSFVVLEAIRDQLNAEGVKGAKQVSIVPIVAPTVASGLEMIRSGEADIACGVNFSWERQKNFDFTLPFASSGIRLLAPKGNDGTPKNLQGKTIGVIADSVAATVLAENINQATFKSYATPSDALQALKSGAIQLLAGDSLWLRASQQETAPADVIVPVEPYARSAVGCIVAESSSSLLDLSNIALGRLMQAYVDGDPKVRKEINAWLGKDSGVGLTEEQINHYYRNVLSTVAEFQKAS
ncbi:MAG: hypothetical protein RLZZ216_2295 [Cyanobacteriota bacterium]|jgi:polar amino acid transport system substrate-binding protein